MKDLAERMVDAEILGKLTLSEREQAARLAFRRTLKRGVILCHQGERWPFVYFITSGSLKTEISSPDGGIFVVSTWEAGEEFWGHSLFDGEGMPSTTSAAKDTAGYQWQGEELLRIIIRNHEAVRALLRRQIQLVRKRRESIYHLAFTPVVRRVAKMLIDKFAGMESPTVQRDLTLEEMAAMVPTSPEVVCRTLYQFQNSGWLRVTRASITLHDRAALEKLLDADK